MTLGTLVVGVDASPGSRRALAFAAELAAPHGARIVAVHCFEPLAHLDELGPGRDLRASRERARLAVDAELERALEGHALERELVVREGEPATVIADVAREHDADLVVVGSRRMGFFQGIALGSTSRRLARLLAGPLLIVPLGEERSPS